MFVIVRALFGALAFAVGGAFATDPLVLFPPADSAGKSNLRLMVFVPGGKVDHTYYINTVEAIQNEMFERYATRLYAVIPSCLGNLCIPVPPTHATISHAVETGKKALLENEPGVTTAVPNRDVFIAGHSLGATAARFFVDSQKKDEEKYAGALLTGTQLMAQLRTPKVPQFLMAGDLDGVSVLNVAEAFFGFRDKVEAATKDGTQNEMVDAWKRALLETGNTTAGSAFVVPGLDHSDFCHGFHAPGDLPSELPYAEALKRIGSGSAAFLASVIYKDATAAAEMEYMVRAVNTLRNTFYPDSKAVINPFVEKLFAVEKEYCSHVQKMLALRALKEVGSDIDTFDKLEQVMSVEVDTIHSGVMLMHHHPHYSAPGDDGKKLHLKVVQRNTAGSSYGQKQSYATEIACKMISADRIIDVLGIQTTKTPSVQTCSEVNEDAFRELALPAASAAARARMEKFGGVMNYVADKPTPSNIGPYWVFFESLAEKDEFVDSKDDKRKRGLPPSAKSFNELNVTSPILYSPITSKVYPGNHYCKYQSPMKALEFVMVGALKNFQKNGPAGPLARGGSGAEAEEVILV